jgi:redox-sensing transcriptional repressor
MELKSVSTQTLQRLPAYLNYLKSLQIDKSANISATAIADALNLNDVQVRKDLSSISGNGRPKVGYTAGTLIYDIEEFLGYHDNVDAVLAGAGNLGCALLSYEGFSRYGLNIVAAFDTDERKIGSEINGKKVLPADKLYELCIRMKIRIGIITVTAAEAQTVCDAMVESGIKAIWNFAPVTLNIPEGVLVKDENMAASLAVLSKHLSEK